MPSSPATPSIPMASSTASRCTPSTPFAIMALTVWGILLWLLWLLLLLSGRRRRGRRKSKALRRAHDGLISANLLKKDNRTSPILHAILALRKVSNLAGAFFSRLAAVVPFRTELTGARPRDRDSIGQKIRRVRKCDWLRNNYSINGYFNMDI